VHLYSSFSMYPPGFFLRGKFIPKIAIFGDLAGGRKATFFKAIKVKVSVVVGTWESLPHAKFCKNCAFGANIYQKLPIFAILVAVSSHF